jgi:hypothetical protein
MQPCVKVLLGQEAEMKRLNNLLHIFLILMIVFTACTKKATTPLPVYKEPLSFEIFKEYEDVPLDTNFVRMVHDTWQNELKDDEVIRNHTWLVGDYKVFIYSHGYTFFIDTSYDEVLFFTTTQPKKCIDKIHSAIAIFEAKFENTNMRLSKIKIYVYVNTYHPIKNEEEAESIMVDYLDEYLGRGDGIPYDQGLIQELKGDLQADRYIREWGDHYVYVEVPHDFGLAIVVNKLTSKLDFLGTSVWVGHGKRYFPSD